MAISGVLLARVMWSEFATKAGAFRSCFFQRRAHSRWTRNFPLYYTASNLSREKLHQITQIFYPEIVHYSILQSASGCGIIMVSRGDGNHFRVAVVQVNEIEKNVKNPLTNFQTCAIIKAQRERAEAKRQVPRETSKSRPANLPPHGVPVCGI